MASLSILQVEESIQNALESLRSKPFTQQLAAVLAFLVPDGYHPVVELQEDGRKKRRTASAENWTPETGEILISFSKDTRQDFQKRPGMPHSGLPHSGLPHPGLPQSRLRESLRPSSSAYTASPVQATRSLAQSASPAVPPEHELCEALEEVERQGRAFVALKWFRDDILPAKGYDWTANPEERQSVLARAVESGMIVTSRIPNPRSPFPTTTIRLNRSRFAAPSGGRRFAPIRVQGEPLSSTILRDRGAR